MFLLFIHSMGVPQNDFIYHVGQYLSRKILRKKIYISNTKKNQEKKIHNFNLIKLFERKEKKNSTIRKKKRKTTTLKKRTFTTLHSIYFQ